MGLDRPIRLFLIFAFASVSIAAIRHLWRISAILLNRPSGSNLVDQNFPQACDLALEESDRTPTVLACIHCVVPDCSLHPSTRQALPGNHFATHQGPQQSCTPFVANTWHCFQLVPSASVLRPVLFNKDATSFCFVEEPPGNLRPVRINSKTSWTSSPSQPTCRESSPDGLGSLISNLNRNVHTRCGIHDVQHLQSRLHTRRFLECDLPEIHIHGHNLIKGLCMIHCHFSF